ncbi:hypothetical protein PPERSA_00140 [Pseudocohnilembus persalinus]|uniref:Transmembrane protein n=1 Tax=Pseudocohnilembus persalinus TaxID=266149 RepID=A0A0V0QCN8_PSEPJ|nr:hypothetical protein PPERSA_00140 [Pseudocohnilembus persalinus]|eukprot:KRW99973.1 hypothetical protein PPERSA_00140 [Pseudocohnilembus persalinus]
MQSIQENGNLKKRVHKNSNNLFNNEIYSSNNINNKEQNQHSKRNSQYGQNLEIQHQEQSYQNLSSVLSSQVMNTVEQELLDKQEEYHVNTNEDIPILIYGFLVYVLFASIIIVYKGVKDLANRTSRSPHIMLYEDPQTYQADIEKILKIKNEIFMERLEWKEFSKLQHKLEKKNLKLKYKPHNIERCQSDQQIKQYQEEIQSIQNENPLNINHKQISYS